MTSATAGRLGVSFSTRYVPGLFAFTAVVPPEIVEVCWMRCPTASNDHADGVFFVASGSSTISKSASAAAVRNSPDASVRGSLPRESSRSIGICWMTPSGADGSLRNS